MSTASDMSSHLKRCLWLLLGALVTLTHCMTIENLPPEQDLPDGGKIWVSSFNTRFEMNYDLNDSLLTTYPSRWFWLQVATGISTIGIKVPNHNLKLLFYRCFL